MAGLRARRGAADDDGAVLVESVFVLPIIVLFIFAIIEFGLFFSTSATATSSTREGARFASANFATAAFPDAAADDVRDSVERAVESLVGLATPVELVIFRAESDGEPFGGLGNCTTRCFRYTWGGGSFTRPAGPGGGSGWSDADACTTDGDGLDSIGIYVVADHNMITGFFGDVATVSHKTVQRLEPLPLEEC